MKVENAVTEGEKLRSAGTSGRQVVQPAAKAGTISGLVTLSSKYCKSDKVSKL